MKSICIIITLGICSPAMAHDQLPPEANNIKNPRKIERFVGDSIQNDRVRDYSRYRNHRRPYCVTHKVTDEYGYVHYFTQCR